jgi:hypothetical protein
MLPARAHIAAAALLVAAPALAQITRDGALAAVYPGAALRAETVFLVPSQQKQVLMLTDTDVPTAPVERFVATKDANVVGRAYVVRTKWERLLISLDAAGHLLGVDAINLDDVATDRTARPIGDAATIGRETTNAIRRAQAIDAVLEKRQAAR